MTKNHEERKDKKLMNSENFSKIKKFLLVELIDEFTEFFYKKNKNVKLKKSDIKNKISKFTPYIERILNLTLLSHEGDVFDYEVFLGEKMNHLKKDIYLNIKPDLRSNGFFKIMLYRLGEELC